MKQEKSLRQALAFLWLRTAFKMTEMAIEMMDPVASIININWEIMGVIESLLTLW